MRARRDSSGGVIRLSEVLFAEYTSQNIQPALPEGYVEGLRATYEQKLASEIPDPAKRAAKIDAELVKELYRWLHRHDIPRSALCLSGGGIRSATFGLGVVQALAHPDFPHESTANQLYSEAQFESYRELGANAAATLCANLPGEPTLAELFATLEVPPAV